MFNGQLAAVTHWFVIKFAYNVVFVNEVKGHLSTHLFVVGSNRVGHVVIHDIVVSSLWPVGHEAAHSADAESVPWAYKC